MSRNASKGGVHRATAEATTQESRPPRHARTAGAPELLPDGPIDPLSELLDRGFVVKVALPLKVERVAAKALQAACGYAKDLASQHAADAAKCSGGGCRRPETAQDVGEVDVVPAAPPALKPQQRQRSRTDDERPPIPDVRQSRQAHRIAAHNELAPERVPEHIGMSVA
jgi:hypothetical protein